MSRDTESDATDELLALAARDDLDEGRALSIIRSPFCSPEVAHRISENKRILGSHKVRELICSVRGVPNGQVLDLLATLPWLSLLLLAQAPQTPPLVRRQAERRLIEKVPRLTSGEKIALARRAHRKLLRVVAATGIGEVLQALLENPRLTETDIQVLLAQEKPPSEVFVALIRNPRWSRRRGVRMAIARNRAAPLPIALSAMAQLAPGELLDIAEDRTVDARVRRAASALKDRARTE